MEKPACPADLLANTLSTMVADGWLGKRLVNGSLHETEVLAGLQAVCAAAGVPARMVEGVASNHPLSDRDIPTRRPDDYRYHTQYFLEVGDRWLSLWLEDYRVFMADFHESASALAEVGAGMDVCESALRPVLDMDTAPPEIIDEFLPPDFKSARLVEDLRAMVALEQCQALDQATAPAPSPSPFRQPRL